MKITYGDLANSVADGYLQIPKLLGVLVLMGVAYIAIILIMRHCKRRRNDSHNTPSK